MAKHLRLAGLLITVLFLVSCSTTPTGRSGDAPGLRAVATPQLPAAAVTAYDAGAAPAAGTDSAATVPAGSSNWSRAAEPTIRMGTGVFVNGQRQQSAAASISNTASSQVESAADEGDITLKFDQASLREFVRVVFEDILNENYLIDPEVKGVVALHTSRPVSQSALIPIMESVLQQNGAALVRERGVYKVVPLAGAIGQAGTPRVGTQPAASGAGFGVQIVPLQYVAAGEMERILTPFLTNGSSLSVDEARNLLILSGPQFRLGQLLEIVEIFDVDWLKGVSFGLFPLQYADATTLVSELNAVIGGDSPALMAGLVRLVPVDRLNAVIAITTKPHYMSEMRKLIEQFDLGADGAPGSRLYVYHLKNAKAEKLAGVLQQLYGLDDTGQQGGDRPGIPQLMPGQGTNDFRRAADVSSPPPPVGAPGAGGNYPARSVSVPPAGDAAASPAEAGVPLAREGAVKIIADQDNNAILVMASPEDYRAIEAAIRRLDTPPRQVLIDATIAEVTLSNGLDYGVRWFLQQNNLNLGFNAPVPETAAGPGLALAIFKSNGNAKLFIDALATATRVKFLSAPQVMVLDNQTATIRVGDQIPVTVRTSQSTVSDDSPIVSEVQFRDTGTLLSVTPRINAGGQVTMNISQEVSLPGSEPAVGGGGNVAIAQRTIDSSVIVRSGETVVLGGLILETRNQGKSGVPLLMNIPVLGALFSTASADAFRTELIVMITPQVVEDENAARAVTDDLRLKMKRAVEYGNSVEAIDLR
jgi:general secretion pathway protein D